MELRKSIEGRKKKHIKGKQREEEDKIEWR
jgi:hypothetical protein